jgi:hypothetical protein
MSMAEPSKEKETKRLRGILALLPVDKVHLFSYDEAKWREKASWIRKKKKMQTGSVSQRRRALLGRDPVSSDAAPDESTTLSELLLAEEGTEATAIYWFDPFQPRAVGLLDPLVLVCRLPGVTGLVVTSSDDRESIRACLSHSGLALLTLNRSFSVVQLLLGWHVSCPPALTVLSNEDGRSIGSKHHEVLALEWNSAPEDVAERWRNGASALSAAQQVQASLLFPTACVVL